MPETACPDPRSGQSPAVGIVGGGQLARMTCEAASALGLAVAVLAEHEDDAAVAVAPEVLIGAPTDHVALATLARRAPVLTFDHEQVDVDLLATLEADGVAVRPGTETLRMAVDKVAMRRRLAEAGVPVPPFAVVEPPASKGGAGAEVTAEVTTEVTAEVTAMVDEVDAFARRHGWPVVLKAARGGYDGKGVWPVEDAAGAREVCLGAARAGVRLLVEERVPIVAEIAVLVVRRPDGESVTWPAVQTVQVDGVCREVLLPGCVDPALGARAETLGRRVAAVAGSTGILAVELFVAGGELLVNEVAARPHNSGHWTIEGAVTSQFENHLRAVLDLPLGSTSSTAASVASVNVFGRPDGAPPEDRLAEALAVGGAHVHLYGKQARPGRKLGHVTVCGEDPVDVRSRAWAAARALGTPVPPTLAPGGEPSARARPRQSGRGQRR
ncbi:MAG: 5-(carboxyamino)imidazole ribonucleotide synthase [Acidimicrobiales bacterium]